MESQNMEERLNALKTDFISITELRESNIQIFEILNNRIKIIKQNYADFIHNYKETLFIFTLDSFHFQGKLIDIEYEEMTRIYHAIMNKMYCEYYKLFKIIVEYVNENIKDEKILNLIQANNQYPVYKDLEPYKQYDFHYIKEIHETIIVTLTSMNGFLMNKQHDLKIYQDKKKIGFNIDNFVNTFNFNNIMIKEKIQLFITYIEFFHKMHSKYLSRFTTKMQLMLGQINYDIKFDGNMQNQETTNKKVLKTLKTDFGEGLNKELLSDLRHTITDESTETTSDNNDIACLVSKTAIYHFEQRDESPVVSDTDENDNMFIPIEPMNNKLTIEIPEYSVDKFTEFVAENNTEIIAEVPTEFIIENNTEVVNNIIETPTELIELVEPTELELSEQSVELHSLEELIEPVEYNDI